MKDTKRNMKKVIMIITAFVAFSMQSSAYNQVRLVITSGTDNKALKQRIEQNVSALMTEINRLQEANIGKIDFPADRITMYAQNDINMLWRNEHFRCIREEIGEKLLTTYDGYQVRGIPLSVNNIDTGEELGYQEAVINFDMQGLITSFYYTINPELYSKLFENVMQDKQREVTDVKERIKILDYVEHFRTAYNQKDLNFLNQVFSNDALIIVGNVIKVQKTEITPSGVKIKYIRKTKSQYLESLSRTFKTNSYIKVSFDNVVIVNHPMIKDVYGVTVHQKWNSTRYSDEGYVFMIWDFRNPDEPQIHVRTWQPEYLDKRHGKKINPNDVFSLGDFELK